MVALPVGIIATAFADAIHRRDFVVTWGMVARVPLFSGLNADEIADIIRLLRAQTVEAGAVIAHRGEPAHSMYFISAGEVEIELDRCADAARRRDISSAKWRCCDERGARRRSERRNARTCSCSMRTISARCCKRQPQLAERLNATVRDRLGRELVSPDGDLVIEELDEEPEAPPKPAKRR